MKRMKDRLFRCAFNRPKSMFLSTEQMGHLFEELELFDEVLVLKPKKPQSRSECSC